MLIHCLKITQIIHILMFERSVRQKEEKLILPNTHLSQSDNLDEDGMKKICHW